MPYTKKDFLIDYFKHFEIPAVSIIILKLDSKAISVIILEADAVGRDGWNQTIFAKIEQANSSIVAFLLGDKTYRVVHPKH